MEAETEEGAAVDDAAERRRTACANPSSTAHRLLRAHPQPGGVPQLRAVRTPSCARLRRRTSRASLAVPLDSLPVASSFAADGAPVRSAPPIQSGRHALTLAHSSAAMRATAAAGENGIPPPARKRWRRMSRACASTPSASSSPATRSSCSPLVEVRPPPFPQAARNPGALHSDTDGWRPAEHRVASSRSCPTHTKCPSFAAALGVLRAGGGACEPAKTPDTLDTESVQTELSSGWSGVATVSKPMRRSGVQKESIR